MRNRAFSVDSTPTRTSFMVVENKLRALEVRDPLLIIDGDPEFQRHVQAISARLQVPVCFASSLEAARKLTPERPFAGVMLSLSALSPAQDLARAIEQIRCLSTSGPLPVALIYEAREELEEVRALWAGASALVIKPLCDASFIQVTRRLDALGRAQQPRQLLIGEKSHFTTRIEHSLTDRSLHVTQQTPQWPLLEMVENFNPDLLLLDAQFNEFATLKLCQHLRSLPRWQIMPIIFFAHHDQSDLRLRAYQAGADDFLTDDLSTAELRARIEVRLEHLQFIRERSDRDSLTGLWTRRGFIDQFHARLSEARRHQRGLALCLLDVDRFKEVNDTHGHLAGDNVLRQLGELLQERFRAEDLRGRWGGEEFTVVLVDQEAQRARQVLKRVLDEFASLRFHSSYSGRIFQVTFSAGIAEFPRDGQDLESLISAADGRLLRAKGSGRQAIFLDGPPL